MEKIKLLEVCISGSFNNEKLAIEERDFILELEIQGTFDNLKLRFIDNEPSGLAEAFARTVDGGDQSNDDDDIGPGRHAARPQVSRTVDGGDQSNDDDDVGPGCATATGQTGGTSSGTNCNPQGGGGTGTVPPVPAMSMI